ncbi:SprT-like domain-containing protein [Nocardioides sp. SYSU DS0663]|uniref:SprT-like domain-containing protein n=1 Tax=Nocardioides sp. SYSU DS0663 TaxID=3416445 RepID=UPI003F4B7BFD
MDLEQALGMARELMDEHGLVGWTVVLDRAKRRAGVCRPGLRQIGLSAPLTQLHGVAEVRDTVLHEIAHALVGAHHGHDAVWRATALRIGCSGRRCTDPGAGTIDGDWVGTCPAGHRVSRHRRPPRPASCSRCSRGFDRAHLLTWTHRGREVPMSPEYDAQLRLVLAGPGSAAATVQVGQRARVVAPGRYHGAVGVVLKRARTRFHVKVPGGVVTVPFSMLEPLEPSTS